ncbi:MAG: hypothetical protein IMZ69_04940 [Spirochaetes bacterium]|nr:hypothetical protein [Spirochaetota bacterium]
MTGWQYLAWILGGLALLVVCLIGALWLGSLARQAFRDVRTWARKRRAKRHELRASRHLIREVRRGRMGL